MDLGAKDCRKGVGNDTVTRRKENEQFHVTLSIVFVTYSHDRGHILIR